MFDFENLDVYKKAKELNKEILKFLKENKQIDSYLRDQLRRASISIVINIAEGSGKFSKADKKNFYTIARSSVYECVSLLEIIFEENQITKERFYYFYQKLEIVIDAAPSHFQNFAGGFPRRLRRRNAFELFSI